jgi:hypothetical protein
MVRQDHHRARKAVFAEILGKPAQVLKVSLSSAVKEKDGSFLAFPVYIKGDLIVLEKAAREVRPKNDTFIPSRTLFLDNRSLSGITFGENLLFDSISPQLII